MLWAELSQGSPQTFSETFRKEAIITNALFRCTREDGVGEELFEPVRE